MEKFASRKSSRFGSPRVEHKFLDLGFLDFVLDEFELSGKRCEVIIVLLFPGRDRRRALLLPGL